MPAWTLCFTPVPDDAEAGALEEAALRHGSHVAWERPQFGRQYALVEAASFACGDDLRAVTRAAVFDGPVIALAVSPGVAEALPGLHHALGGPGAPTGVLGCARVANAVVVEWDLDRTPYAVIEALIAAELGPYGAAHANALLSPLPLEWLTRLAAYGLRAPDITPDRVLERALEVHGVAD